MCKPETSAPPSGPEQIEPVPLKEDEKWLESFNLSDFEADMRQLNKSLLEAQGEADVTHLNKILNYNKLFTVLGFATLWMSPNPFTIICLSLGLFSRWTMIGHHVCHGGYDKTSASNNGYNRFKFGVGSLYRRVVDWFDWMLPEAWNVEHNLMHHYHLNEGSDPDLVERNLKSLRDMQIPKFLKYLTVLFFMLTWKWSYYAVNTFAQLELVQYRKTHKLTPEQEKINQTKSTTLYGLLSGDYPEWVSPTKYFAKVLLPFLVGRFLVAPLPFYYIFGPEAFYNALINLVLADLLTNLHSFIVIVPNHAGLDMYTFSEPCKPKSGHFYLRQILGSANFATGNDFIDFSQGWLNYQIEHHCFPDMSMLTYRKSQPLVKALCDKHGVPYIQESVFVRLKKTVDIMVGDADMRPFPVQYY